MSLPFPDRPIRGARQSIAVLVALFALGISLAGALTARDAESATGPNVVFFLTDDQTAGELAKMPNVQLLANAGTTFRRAYSSFPLCCPSRATLLSGRYMHNHGVRGNLEPYGGWQRFYPQEPNALPVRIHDNGYYNIHIGKYLNGYSSGGIAWLPVPAGWDEWYGKLSADSLYFNYQLIEKTGPTDEPSIEFYGARPGDYQTDAFRDKALDFIADLESEQEPFMMNLWFNAPHGPFEPAPRHLYSLSASPLQRLPGFNEKDISDKPPWLRKRYPKRLGRTLKRTLASERHRREEQLLSVDEAIGRVVNRLGSEGLLDETYIIFASDNGFFRGEHRIAGGKYLPYEPSTRVPLVIRGPGIPVGTTDELVSLADVPQTILDAVGGPDPSLDGRSLLPYARNHSLRSTRPILLEADIGPTTSTGESAHVSAKARGAVARTGLARRGGVRNLDQERNPIKSRRAATYGGVVPAYRAIRTDRYLYVLYANGQTELYDMARDPAQLRSLARDRRYGPVRKWLLNALIPLSSCAGPSCNFNVGTEPLPLKGPKPKPPRRKGKR